MYGAIFGDIIGSRFEFDRGGKTKDFELYTEEDSFTDDTVMTIAVAEALLKAGKEAAVEEIRRAVTRSMKEWGHRYPDAGYGGRFYTWLFSKKSYPEPYGSYGNGSAMRVSAAGWLYDSLERTREVAKATAEVTHNHPEGIKGAECTAAVMYLARKGASKETIRAYVTEEFGYDLHRTVDELRPLHEHVESCQDSLPKALVSFLEGESYEDVVRNAVSLGGDTDTLAAIAGAMAEAFFGIPVLVYAQGKTYLPKDILAVLDEFDNTLGRSLPSEESDEARYVKNRYITLAVYNLLRIARSSDKAEVSSSETDAWREALTQLLKVLIRRMLEEGEAPTPMIDKNHVMDSMDPGQLIVGGSFSLNEEVRLTVDLMQDGEGNMWVPLFTEYDEIRKGKAANIIINCSIKSILENGLHNEKVKGVVINPFDQSFLLNKEALGLVMKYYEQIKEDEEES